MQCTTAIKYRTEGTAVFGKYRELRSLIGFDYFTNFVELRQAVQDNILNEFFLNAITQNDPVCIFMMGIPGSGKTTYAKQLSGIHIDPDAFKLSLPEFHTFPKHLASGVVHREAAFLAEIAIMEAETRRLRITWDAASSNSQWLKTTVCRLKKSGYRVELVKFVVSYETSYLRCVNRDRYVPKFVIQQMIKSTEEAFLENSALFDSVNIIHT